MVASPVPTATWTVFTASGPSQLVPNNQEWLDHDGTAVALWMTGSCAHREDFQTLLPLAGLRSGTGKTPNEHRLRLPAAAGET